MPLPTVVFKVPQSIDPSDIENITLRISKAGVDSERFPLLDAGENIAQYELALTAEAIAVGLRIKDEAPYFTNLSGLLLNFTIDVDPAKRSLPIFNKGVTVGIELTVLTDAIAPRRKQRTIAIKVIQQ